MPAVAIRPTNTETIDLRRWFTEWHEGVVRSLFGELVKRAAPIIEHYHSDLFLDAKWMEEHLTANLKDAKVAQAISEFPRYTFYYAADDYGTAIGEDKNYVFEFRKTLRLAITVLLDRDQVWKAYIVSFSDRE